MEKKANTLFQTYTNRLSNAYGTKALWTTQLDIIGKFLFKKKYLGTHPQDKVVLDRPGYQIVNTDKSNKKGVHWVALYRPPNSKNLYVYDSYGRSTKNLLKYIYAAAKSRKLTIKESKRDAEQHDTVYDKELCGVLSMAWLWVVKSLGVRAAATI